MVDGRPIYFLTYRLFGPNTRPAWAWLFMFACAELHVLNWAGIWSFVPALVGVLVCAAITDIPTWSASRKTIGCVVTVVLVWAFFYLITARMA